MKITAMSTVTDFQFAKQIFSTFTFIISFERYNLSINSTSHNKFSVDWVEKHLTTDFDNGKETLQCWGLII